MTACSSSSSQNNGNETNNRSTDLVEVDQTSYEVSVILALRLGLVDREGDTLLGIMTSVEMQPEVIHMWGTYTNSAGNVVPGTADVVFSVENGKLIAKITAVDVEGLDVDHPRVLKFNQVLVESFTQKISDNEIVEFSKVEIVGSNMEVTYKTTAE
ncbi:MAG: hypothetical protein MUO54_13520 [Anaerolineales bacterium]|nr:hypothetical protein [Anaerolineales bacterium]